MGETYSRGQISIARFKDRNVYKARRRRKTDRDCHGLLYPRTRTPGVQQGTGMGCVYPTLAIPVPPAGGWRVSGGAAHSNSARPDVNKQRQALLINIVSIHHHCPSSFVMTTGKVFFIYSMFYCY